VLRVDFRDEPTETVDLRYPFSREIGRIAAGERVALGQEKTNSSD
jgi:hypothetical protein